MKLKLPAVILAQSWCMATLPSLAWGQQSKIRVHVTDNYGLSVQAERVTLTGRDSSRDLRQDEAATVSYGSYTLSVDVRGFGPARVPVVVDQPDQLLAVAMRLGAFEGDPPRCDLFGRVTPASGASSVRLMQLYGTYLVDVPVARGGSFEVRGLSCGDYMLITISSKGCIVTQLSRVGSANGTVEIRLPEGDSGACTRTGTAEKK